jgi:hypothetical protein
MLDTLCSPAVFYLVCAIISLLIGINMEFDEITLLGKGFFIFIWTMFLNFLCTSGHETVSWLLVFLPFIFLAVTALATMRLRPSGHPFRRRGRARTVVVKRQRPEVVYRY